MRSREWAQPGEEVAAEDEPAELLAADPALRQRALQVAQARDVERLRARGGDGVDEVPLLVARPLPLLEERERERAEEGEAREVRDHLAPAGGVGLHRLQRDGRGVRRRARGPGRRRCGLRLEGRAAALQEPPVDAGEGRHRERRDEGERQHLDQVAVDDEVVTVGGDSEPEAHERRVREVVEGEERDRGEARRARDGARHQQEADHDLPADVHGVDERDHRRVRGHPAEGAAEDPARRVEIAGRRPRAGHELGVALVEEVPPDRDPQQGQEPARQPAEGP